MRGFLEGRENRNHRDRAARRGTEKNIEQMNNPPSLKLRRTKGKSNDEVIRWKMLKNCSLALSQREKIFNKQFSTINAQGKDREKNHKKRGSPETG